MSQEDISRSATAEGGTAIHCQRISDFEGAKDTARGWNYLRRILAGIASA